MTPNKPPQKTHRLHLKLRGKFIVVISLVLVVIYGAMGFFLLRNTRSNLTYDLNHETQAFAALATKPVGDNYELYSQSGSILIQQQMQKFAYLDPNITNIAVVNLEGLSQFSLTGKPINVSTQDVTSFESTTRSNSKGQVVLAVQPYINDNGIHSYAIAYEVSPAQVERTIAQQEKTILILIVLGLLVSAAITYEFINYFFIHPINQLNKSAKTISAGNYEQQVESKREDEIGTLTNSINYMASTLKTDITKLQELDKQKNEFIRIVSHNLRTPLSIIQGNISLLRNAQLDERFKKMVEGVEGSARDLNTFSEQMLTIANLESNAQKSEPLEEMSLNDLLNPLIREYNEIAGKKPVMFKAMVNSGETKFYGNHYQLAGAVRNLLDNAVKFTPQSGEVELIAGPDEDKILIRVRDHGVGIREEEMPKLFTKFHRGSETLTYNYEGTGIGLYVTKLVVEQHGGKVYVQSKVGEGSLFTIELPTLNPGAAESL